MNWGDVLTQSVIPALVTILVPVVTTLAVVGIRYFTARTSIEIPARTQQVLLEEVIPGAIGYAAQQAKRAAKGLERSKVDRLEWAVTFAQSEIERRGLPELARDQLIKLIESELGGAT